MKLQGSSCRPISSGGGDPRFLIQTLAQHSQRRGGGVTGGPGHGEGSGLRIVPVQHPEDVANLLITMPPFDLDPKDRDVRLIL